MIERRIDQYELTSNIDADLQALQNIILEAQSACILLRVVKDNQFRIGKDTEAAIKYKNIMTRRWQRSSSPPERIRLKADINNTKRLIGELVKRDRNQSWNRLLSQTNSNRKKFWNLSKSLRSKNAATHNLLDEAGNLLITGNRI